MASSPPILYMIRHGEKPPKLPNGEDAEGLSERGLERAQALVEVFGRNSPYEIGYIIAQHPKKSGKEDRPSRTVAPLAQSLPDVPFNTEVQRDDSAGAAAAVNSFQGPGNILLCWEHGQLTDIATALGVPDAPQYPDDRFDIIWTLIAPYNSIKLPWTSENCPGLDNAGNEPLIGQPSS